MIPGYDVIRWRDVLLKLGQTMTFFTTNKEAPFYSELKILLSLLLFNTFLEFSVISVDDLSSKSSLCFLQNVDTRWRS